MARMFFMLGAVSGFVGVALGAFGAHALKQRLPADLFDVFEDDFGVLYDQIRNLARQTLLLRRRIPEGTYLAPEGNADDLPTGDVDLVQRLLFIRRGALRNANMDALLAMAQRMPTARFAPPTSAVRRTPAHWPRRSATHCK